MKYPTDKQLHEYLELQLRIRDLQKRLDQLKQLCKDVGTFSTDRYAVVVLEQCQERLATLEDVSKIFGYAKLQKYGLIKSIKFSVVKVSPIGFKVDVDAEY